MNTTLNFDPDSRSADQHSFQLELDTVRYSPESALLSPLTLFRRIIDDCWKFRGLMWILFTRDLRAQYRQSVLGYIWLMIPVVSTTVVWMLLSSMQVIRVDETQIPYPVYVLLGSMIWTLFASSVMQPLASFQSGQNVFMKLNVPPEAFVVAGLGKLLFDFLVRMLVLIPVLAAYRIVPASSFALFPVGLFFVVVIGTSLGYAMIPIGSLYSDVGRAASTLLSFAMYLTPVVYPPPTSGITAEIVRLNPLTAAVSTTRDWLTLGTNELAGSFLLTTSLSLVLLVAAVLVLRAVLPIIVERMGM